MTSTTTDKRLRQLLFLDLLGAGHLHRRTRLHGAVPDGDGCGLRAAWWTPSSSTSPGGASCWSRASQRRLQRPRQIALTRLPRRPRGRATPPSASVPRQCCGRLRRVGMGLMVAGIGAQHARLPVGLQADPPDDPVPVQEGQYVVAEFPFLRRGIDLDPVVKRRTVARPATAPTPRGRRGRAGPCPRPCGQLRILVQKGLLLPALDS